LEDHYGDLEQDALLNAKPLEADERISNVLGVPYPEHEPCCHVLYQLTMANQVGRQPRQ